MARHAFKAGPRATGAPERLDLSRFQPENRRRLSGPGLRTFVNIADLWGLSEEQRRLVLGYPPRSTYQNWLKAAREQRPLLLDLDVLTRISAVLGIHQALQVLFARPREGVDWLLGPHDAPVFGGQRPLDLMVSGAQDGLLTVRRFLDAARGGQYMAPNPLDHSFEPYADAEIVIR